MKWFFTIIKALIYLPSRVLFPCKIIGKKLLPKGRTYITVTNHMSLRDVIVLDLYLPGFRYVLAKKELEKKKTVKFLLKMMGAIYIDRKTLDLRAIRECVDGLKKYPLAIFPEGTRNKESEQMQQVKGGAALIAVKADSIIVPVMIHHRGKLFRRNYMIVGEKIDLPYTSKDRFNAEAMNVCSKIMSEKMAEQKELLDTLVANKTWRQYNKDINAECKAKKKAAKVEKKLQKKQNGNSSAEVPTGNVSTDSDTVSDSAKKLNMNSDIIPNSDGSTYNQSNE